MTCGKAEGITYPKMQELAGTLIHIASYHTGDERGARTELEAIDAHERLHGGAIFIHGTHNHNNVPCRDAWHGVSTYDCPCGEAPRK